jgi:hypothetical protein
MRANRHEQLALCVTFRNRRSPCSTFECLSRVSLSIESTRFALTVDGTV